MGKRAKGSYYQSICDLRKKCKLGCNWCLLLDTVNCPNPKIAASKKIELGCKTYRAPESRNDSYQDYFSGYVLNVPHKTATRII